MPILHATLQGRAGNQILQWLFCRALASFTGAELRCSPWVGDRIFQIDSVPYVGPELPRFNEHRMIQWSMLPGTHRHDVEFRGYAQMQSCMIYRKFQVKEWLRFRPEILDRLLANHYNFQGDSIVAHHRKGDMIGYSYPVVSRMSFRRAAWHFFGEDCPISYVSEEEPGPHEGLPDDLSFLPDLYRLMRAPTLMRANSSFSFVAGLLSDGIVLSPRIDGLKGGVEHDGVRFEAGNHCRLADFDFCTDLRVMD